MNFIKKAEGVEINSKMNYKMSIVLPSWNYSDAGRWKSLRVQRVAPLLHWIISFRTYLQRRVNVHLEICLRNSCNSGCKKEQYWQQFFFRVIIFEFLWHLNSFDFFNSCEPSNNYWILKLETMKDRMRNKNVWNSIFLVFNKNRYIPHKISSFKCSLNS